jgi:glycosyltransferase involved in cell wall biosynthesis
MTRTTGAVSVLIPCRNGAAYIAETLTSALHQTLPPLEIIVVDDGSTDGSREIVAGYGERVKLLSNTGRGASAARNHAASAAQGEFLQFLDADDLLEPSALEARVAALQQSGADVAVSDWCRITEQSGVWGTASTVSGRLPAPDVPADVQILCGFWAPPAAILYRRSVCERIGAWRESLPVIQDARFLLDAARVGGRFVHVDRLGARYRQHASGSLSTSNRKRFWTDVLRNAKEVEAIWLDTGRCGAEARAVLADLYARCVRAGLLYDAALFDAARQELERFPEYRPSRSLQIAMAMQPASRFRVGRAVVDRLTRHLP